MSSALIVERQMPMQSKPIDKALQCPVCKKVTILIISIPWVTTFATFASSILPDRKACRGSLRYCHFNNCLQQWFAITSSPTSESERRGSQTHARPKTSPVLASSAHRTPQQTIEIGGCLQSPRHGFLFYGVTFQTSSLDREARQALPVPKNRQQSAQNDETTFLLKENAIFVPSLVTKFWVVIEQKGSMHYIQFFTSRDTITHNFVSPDFKPLLD